MSYTHTVKILNLHTDVLEFLHDFCVGFHIVDEEQTKQNRAIVNSLNAISSSFKPSSLPRYEIHCYVNEEDIETFEFNCTLMLIEHTKYKIKGAING